MPARRVVVVSLRLTHAEYAAVQGAALGEGRTPSAIIRSRLFGEPRPVLPIVSLVDSGGRERIDAV